MTVGWHSAPWLERMVGSAEGVDEIVVVDHSEDPAEARRLRALGAGRVVTESNTGYGAGLNRGVRESSGEILVLANPDVQFAPGAIERLAELATRPGAGAAGPLLLWTRERPWQLPHSAEYTWFREWVASALPRLARRLALGELDRVWKAGGPVHVPVIGGAVLVTTRARFEASRGFDERFFLFFEENDWCRRLRAAGSKLLVDPEAVVYHDWGHAIGESAAGHHLRSLALYRRLHFPAWYLRRYPEPPVPRDPPLRQGQGPGCSEGDELLLVTSPRCAPAARLVVDQGVADVADLVPESAQPGRYLVLRRTGRRLQWIRTIEHRSSGR